MGFSKSTHLIVGLLILLGVGSIFATSRPALVYLVLALFPFLIVLSLLFQAKRNRPIVKDETFFWSGMIPLATPAAVFLFSLVAAIIYFSPNRLATRLADLRRNVLKSQVLMIDQPYPIATKEQFEQISKVSGWIQKSESFGLSPSPELYLEAGLLYFSVKDPRSAQAQFAKAVQAASEPDATRGSTLAIAYNDLGVTLEEQKKVDESLKAFDDALKNAPARTTRLIAELNKARVYRMKGQYRDALDISDRILVEPDVDDYLRATALRVKGLVAEDQGKLLDADGALSFYMQAAHLYDKGGRLQELAITHNNIGNVYISMRNSTDTDIANAISNHRAALEINTNLKEEEGMADSYASLAYDYFVKRELDKAMQYAEQALWIFRRRKEPVKEAAVLDTLGQIYQKKGDDQNAIASLRQSLRIAREVGNRFGQAESLKNLAAVYAEQHQCKAAMPLLLESQSIFEQIPSEEKAKEVKEMLKKCETGASQSPRLPRSR
jgi:tetratricopeptide (TPR) repeat protein